MALCVTKDSGMEWHVDWYDIYVGRARVVFFPITVQFTAFCNVILLFTLLYSPSVYINTDNHKGSLLVVLYTATSRKVVGARNNPERNCGWF